MKKILSLIIFLGSLLIPGQVTGQHPLILSGDREAQQGNTDGAISYYLEALEKFPFNYHLFRKLGDSYRLSGAFDQALGWYEKCMITGKFHRDDSCRYAELLLMNGRIDKAVTAYEELLRTAPGDPEVIRMLGCCRFAATELAKPGLPPVTNCEDLNSPRNESGLGYTGEGLLFSSNRPGRDFLTVDDLTASGGSDFYLARRNEKTNVFDRPVRITGKLNSPWNETGFSMSQMSQMSFFSRTEPSTGKCRLFSAKRTKTQWTEAKQVMPGNDAFNFEHPALSSDGLTLWFVSDMPGGVGGKDLWKVSVSPTGETGTPVNAGPVINTRGDENYPSIWGDTLLIFSSNGHIGMGGMDIYYCRLEKNGSGTPVNAGAPVNSTSDDFGLLLKEGAPGGYFSSNRISGRQEDIFEFTHDIRRSIVHQPEIAREIPEVTNLEPARMEGPDADSVIQCGNRNTLSVAALPGIIQIATADSTQFQPFSDENRITYRIQVMAARKPIDPAVYLGTISDVIQLHGLSVEKEDNYFKYRVGDFTSKSEAGSVLQVIRKRGLRDCFMVIMQ